MSAPKPLFCPFCGSNDVDNGRADARYHCYRCGADGPQIPYAPDDKAWTWSTRATQPDPRDEVIAKLVEALEDVVKNENWLVNQKFKGKSEWFDLSMQRAALAAAKAVQK